MSKVTLGETRKFVARFVGEGGTCATSPVVRDRVNEAQRRLFSKADDDSLTRNVLMVVQGNTVVLPWECASIRFINRDGVPRRLYHSLYEFVDGGPGVVGAGGHSSMDFMSLGAHYATCFDPPDCGGPYRLLFVTAENLGSKTVRVTGATPDGSHVLDLSGFRGEDVPVAQWFEGQVGRSEGFPTTLSTNTYKTIDNIVLPEGRTKYLALYAVNPTTRGMHLLANYSPAEQVPSYTRYRILGACCDTESCLLTRCKMRYVPAILDTDVLQIQNMDAIKAMVRAIEMENVGDPNAVGTEANAVRLLAEALEDKVRGQIEQVTISRDGMEGNWDGWH